MMYVRANIDVLKEGLPLDKDYVTFNNKIIMIFGLFL